MRVAALFKRLLGFDAVSVVAVEVESRDGEQVTASAPLESWRDVVARPAGPATVKFTIDEADPDDQYEGLFEPSTAR